jgi:hypothetical protein
MTAMAIVPLLEIKINVMIAIRIRGIGSPPKLRAKTSLGFGHGTTVDIRTVMYESKKQLKMKVSLSRKIHIIALPQGTFLNALWSEAQSATTPCMPSGRAWECPVSVTVVSVILILSSSRKQQKGE